jgi:hypothetical protein
MLPDHLLSFRKYTSIRKAATALAPPVLEEEYRNRSSLIEKGENLLHEGLKETEELLSGTSTSSTRLVVRGMYGKPTQSHRR